MRISIFPKPYRQKQILNTFFRRNFLAFFQYSEPCDAKIETLVKPVTISSSFEHVQFDVELFASQTWFLESSKHVFLKPIIKNQRPALIAHKNLNRAHLVKTSGHKICSKNGDILINPWTELLYLPFLANNEATKGFR